MTQITDSQRAEWLDAGRLGNSRFEGFDSGGPGCSGGPMRSDGLLIGDNPCREPIAYVKNGLSYPIMLCRDHAVAYERQGVKGGSWHCSMCGAPQKAGWTLDGSGRGIECQP